MLKKLFNFEWYVVSMDVSILLLQTFINFLKSSYNEVSRQYINMLVNIQFSLTKTQGAGALENPCNIRKHGKIDVELYFRLLVSCM